MGVAIAISPRAAISYRGAAAAAATAAFAPTAADGIGDAAGGDAGAVGGGATAATAGAAATATAGIGDVAAGAALATESLAETGACALAAFAVFIAVVAAIRSSRTLFGSITALLADARARSAADSIDLATANFSAAFGSVPTVGGPLALAVGGALELGFDDGAAGAAGTTAGAAATLVSVVLPLGRIH